MTIDPIADMLTRMRNALNVKHKNVSIPVSKTKLAITELLLNEGYIASYEVKGDVKKEIVITLKYVDGIPAITGISRESKPGCRQYFEYRGIPRVLNGMGISILTTSKGVLKDTDCRAQKVGGEMLCKVW